jgi:trypsin
VRLAVLALGLASTALSLGAQQASPFTLTFDHQQSGFARTLDDEQSGKEADGEMALRSEGKETIACGETGAAGKVDAAVKRSVASSRALARLDQSAADSLTFVLSSEAQAQGGITTSCARCLGSTCLVPTTTPSGADAESTSNGRVTIRFDQPAAGSRYSIAIDTEESVLHGAKILYQLEDDAGQNLLEGRTLPTTVEFLPKKGARLVFDLNLSSYAGSRGASVLRNASGLVRLRVAVRSSPILGLDGKPALLGTTSVKALTGGRPTTALVLLRGSVLCAATLLERETAITAAPCVKQLSSAEQADLQVLPVATASHVDVRSVALLADERTVVLPRLAPADDIALLRLQGSGGWRGASTTPDFIRLRAFVGSPAVIQGFVDDQSSIQPGRADVVVAQVETTTMTLRSTTGTCRFTIGSGVFLNQRNTPQLIGLITGTVPGVGCKATRLELYRNWISGISR